MNALHLFLSSFSLVIFCAAAAGAQEATPTTPPPWMRDAEKVHDPSTIIAKDGINRVLCTGMGISLLREQKDGRWLREGRIFPEGGFPKWHEELVPGNRGYLWAPDIIFAGGKYLIYYSVSTFGSNRSAIGLVSGVTLDPASGEWAWKDEGPVLVSEKSDRYNAIDPALFLDPVAGGMWMTFGSFWDGIHIVPLDTASGLRKKPEAAPLRLAGAPEIEAPFLTFREGYYYLFLNHGKCCKGINSTYDIRVGRSKSITGPYVDKTGTLLTEGGGTLVLASEDRWIGPGHASLFTRDGREYLVHHYYDRDLNGKSRLRMVPLRWQPDGWPAAGE